MSDTKIKSINIHDGEFPLIHLEFIKNETPVDRYLSPEQLFDIIMEHEERYPRVNAKTGEVCKGYYLSGV